MISADSLSRSLGNVLFEQGMQLYGSLSGQIELLPRKIFFLVAMDYMISGRDKYFSNNQYDEAFNLLLINYPKNKNGCKNKFIEYFDALGSTSEVTVLYRKKLSKIMFS